MKGTFLLALIWVFSAGTALSQGTVLLYDARSEGGTASVSSADQSLVQRNALPAARRAWGDACEEAVEFIGSASGSFTVSGKAQRAVVYRYCETGHAFGNNGLVIIENGRVVRNVIYNGGGESEVRALPDINANGLSELLIGGGSTNQGYSKSVISILELTASGVAQWGDADVYEDNCGAVERCKMTAFRITAKPGKVPVYLREQFQKRGGKWKSSGAPKPFKLRRSYLNPPAVYRNLD